ncbi:MAG: hypothetical protein M1812_002254 [Candelaria pacifica]|nr:MAG: hypothetical protein M1812_002254 [Candelaria pacifica]
MWNREWLANHFAGREDPPVKQGGFLKNILTEGRRLRAFSALDFFRGTKKPKGMLASFDTVEAPPASDILTEARKLASAQFKPFGGQQWLFRGVGNPTVKVASFNAKAPAPGEEFQEEDEDDGEGSILAESIDGDGSDAPDDDEDDDDDAGLPGAPKAAQEDPRAQAEQPCNWENLMDHRLHEMILASAKQAHEQEITTLKKGYKVKIDGRDRKLVAQKVVTSLNNKRLQKQLKDSRIYRMIAENRHATKVEDLEEQVVLAKESKETAIEEMKEELEKTVKRRDLFEGKAKKAISALKELKEENGDLQMRHNDLQQRYEELRGEHEKIKMELWARDQGVAATNTDIVAVEDDTQGGLAPETANMLQANKGLADLVTSLRTELDDKSMTISNLRAKLGQGDRKAVYSETQEDLGRALGRVRQWQSYANASGEIHEQVFAELSILDGDRATLQSQLAQLEEDMEAKDKALASLTKTYDFCVAQREKDFEERAALEEQYTEVERVHELEMSKLKKEHRLKQDECHQQTTLAEGLQTRNDDLHANAKVILVDMAQGYDRGDLVEIMSRYIRYTLEDVKTLEDVCERQDAEYLVAEKDIQYWRNRVAEVDLDLKKIGAQEQQIRELESENERIILDMDIHGDLRKKLEDAQLLVKQLTAKLKSKDAEWAKIVADEAQGAEKHCLQYLRGRVAELTATSQNARRREKKLYDEIDILKKDVELSRKYYDIEDRFGDAVETIESFKAERDQAITERNEAVAVGKVHEEKLVAIELQGRSLTSDDMQVRHAMQAIYHDEHNTLTALQTQYGDLHQNYVQLERVNGQLESELAMRVAQVEGNPGLVVRRIEELGGNLRDMRQELQKLTAEKTQAVRQLGAAVQPPYESPRIFELQDDVNHLQKLLAKNQEVHLELYNAVKNGIDSGMRQKITQLEWALKEKEIKNKELGIKNILLYSPRDMDFILSLDTRPKEEQNEEARTVTEYQYEFW